MSILENISETEPCGVDFKYDDKYISIELEIEKNFNVSNTGETQWDLVIQQSEDILTHHSKDLKILSYWLYAQWKVDGWKSFIQVFDTYTTMLERYHETLFPTVEKRKIKIFEWTENVLEESLLKVLENTEKETLSLLNNILERLENTVPLLVSSEFYFFKDLRLECVKYLQISQRKEEEQTRQLELQKQEELKKQEEHAALSEAEQLRRTEEAEVLSKFSSQESQKHTLQLNTLDNKDINGVQSSMLSLSQTLLEKSPGDFIGYKILFSLAEILFEESFRDTTITTDDFIPSNDIIQVSRTLEEGTVSLSQLEALVEQLLLRPTWLEGYYIVSKILYKLSQTKDAIQVGNMLFYFLSKDEKIVNMTIRDQKMISENIVSWMQTKLLSLNNNDNSAIEYQHTYQEVLKIKKEENAQNALVVLEEHYQKAQGEESRFRWRLLMVEFALEIKDKKLALSLLYELERLIEKYQINAWQPTLAVAVYEILLKPIFTQELSAETKERIYGKLSILDIQKVIKL